jgi:ketosteroid isomerase-like protein
VHLTAPTRWPGTDRGVSTARIPLISMGPTRRSASGRACVVLDMSRMPDGGIYHGREGIRDFYVGWLGTWNDFRVEPERLVDAGDRIVDVNQVIAIGRGSGAPVRMRTGNVWTVENGKVVRHVGYPDASEALKAVGLPN